MAHYDWHEDWVPPFYDPFDWFTLALMLALVGVVVGMYLTRRKDR